MKTSQWGKTLLYTYKYLPRITDAIDKMVEQAALNSFYFSNNQKDNGVLAVSEKISKLIERKNRLINIKVLVDKALLACEEMNGKILVEKFIDDEMCESIAKRYNLNIRTYFRKQEVAEANFYSNIVKLGFDENRLNKYLSEEKWIIDVLEKYQGQNEDEVELD